MAKCSRIFNPFFRTDILNDAAVLQEFVSLQALNKDVNQSKLTYYMTSFTEYPSGDDEIIKFLLITTNADNGAHPLLWCKGKD